MFGSKINKDWMLETACRILLGVKVALVDLDKTLILKGQMVFIPQGQIHLIRQGATYIASKRPSFIGFKRLTGISLMRLDLVEPTKDSFIGWVNSSNGSGRDKIRLQIVDHF